MVGTSFVYISHVKPKHRASPNGKGYVSLFSDYRWPRVNATNSSMASNSSSSSYKPGKYFRRFQLQIMTESQPEGSETTRGAMEEDLLEESAFEVEETDQYTHRANAKSFTNVNKRKSPASQNKSTNKANKFSWSTEKVEVLLIF